MATKMHTQRSGDYTKERKALPGQDFDTVALGIREHRKKKAVPEQPDR
ncbi:hypothetical protein [Methanoculleus frigidifontis]|nr:hypothetical protein [Methanoculleus sp. FWC-SCC1]